MPDKKANQVVCFPTEIALIQVGASPDRQTGNLLLFWKVNFLPHIFKLYTPFSQQVSAWIKTSTRLRSSSN